MITTLDYPTAAMWVAIVFIGYITIAFSTKKKDDDDRRYPPFAPGGVWKLTKMRMTTKDPLWMLDIAAKLGTSVYQMPIPTFPPRSLTAVGEPAVSRAILTDSSTIKPMGVYGYFRKLYGGSPTIFTLNGPEWHAKRKAVAPAFSSNHIKRMNRVALDKTESWIENKLEKLGTNDSFDVAHEMISIVLGALSETAFEYEMSNVEKQLFGDELKIALKEFTRKTPIFPLRNVLGMFIPERRRAGKASENLIGLTKKIMKAYREKEGTRVNEGTIIQLIMESDVFATDDEKAAQLLEFLVAGHDTTAYSIAFIMIELAKNQAIQTELRNALRELSPDEWSSCDQLKWVVREGMRLHPVGRSLRTTGKDISTSRNEVIKSDSMCVCHFIMQFRNPDIFESAGSFLPSRWENATKEMLDSVTPFSLGKQNCVGQSLAKVETFGILARICSEWELSIEEEGSVDFSLTVKPTGARLRARKV